MSLLFNLEVYDINEKNKIIVSFLPIDEKDVRRIFNISNVEYIDKKYLVEADHVAFLKPFCGDQIDFNLNNYVYYVSAYLEGSKEFFGLLKDFLEISDNINLHLRKDFGYEEKWRQLVRKANHYWLFLN